MAIALFSLLHAKEHVLTVCRIWFANTRYFIYQLDMFLVVVVSGNLTINGWYINCGGNSFFSLHHGVVEHIDDHSITCRQVL